MAENVKYILEVRDKFSANLKKMKKQLKETDSAALHLAKSFKKVGQTMTNRLTKPIAAVAVVAAVTFARLEKGFNDVLGLLNAKEVEEFGAKLKLAQQEAIAAGFSIADVNEALFNTVSGLGASDKAIEAFREGQKLAIAGNAKLAVSTDGIVSILNAYGKEITKVNEVSNTFFSSQVKGKTDVSLLASNVGKIAPAAKRAGVSFQELVGGMSALTLGGIATDEGTTALRGALAALSDPSEGARKILKELEVPFGVVAIRAAGFKETIEKLNIASEKFPDKIGKAIPNIRALTAVTALSEDKLVVWDEILVKIAKDVKDGTGLNQKYKDQLKGLSQVFKEAKGEVTLLSMEIGAILAPTIISILKVVKGLARSFRNLSPAMKTTLVVIAGILAVAGPLIAFISAIGIAMAGMAVVSGTLGISLLPLAAIVVGISAAIAGIIFLIVKMKRAFSDGGLLSSIRTLGKAMKILAILANPLLLIPKAVRMFSGAAKARSERETPAAAQDVNVGGELTVRAEKGTEITGGNMFNPNLGLNMAGALGGS